MRPPVKKLVKQIEEARGNISAVARAFGKPRSTIYSWINSSTTAQQALKDQRELVVDVAESRLFKNMADGDNQAIFYILNNMKEARERGWGKRVDITTDGEPVTPVQYIEIVRPDDN